MLTKTARAVSVVATAVLLVLLAATSAHAAQQQERRLSMPGAYGIGLYGVSGETRYIQAYIHDTAGDGKCAELWLDFRTEPHEHFDALRTVACGHERSGWGYKYTSTDGRIDGFRVAICTSRDNGVGRVCHNPNGTRATWPIESYNAGTYLYSEVGTN